MPIKLDTEYRMQEHHLTGYFRDGLRRVDLVLVSQDHRDPEVEAIKMQFLVNAVDAGFHIEIEVGVMNNHQRLLFTKIHAPDTLIHLYGRLFDIYKCFKRNHAEEISSWVLDEKLLLKLVRFSYPGLFEVSTLERSLIAYKTMQMISFGEPKNYVGVHRLVDRGIFLDVYPLHEGPHFLVPNQDPEKLNGRQALFYKGVGYSNLFLPMPIHLIREYLGEKIGFLFAFYQFTLIFLLVIGIPGVIMYFPDSNPGPTYISKANGLNNIYICPKCMDLTACPPRKWFLYVFENRYKMSLDNTLYHWYSLIVVLAGIIMFLLWRLKEYYLNWIWEVNEEEARTALRTTSYDTRSPFYSTSSWKLERSIKWMMYKIKTVWKPKEFCITFFFLCFFFSLLPALMLLQQQVMHHIGKVETKYKSYNFKIFKYVNIGIAFLNGIIILMFEKVWYIFVKWFSRCTNYISEDDYEQSYIVKLFGFSSIVNFTYIFFIMFLKGAFYTYLLDRDRYISKSPIQPGMLHCGLISCIDEAYIVAVYTYVGKTAVQELINVFKWFRLPDDVPGLTEPVAATEPAAATGPAGQAGPATAVGTAVETRTIKDPERVPYDDENVPSWEREYSLLPFNTDHVYKKFNHIFLQLAFATFFVWIFPLGPLIIFILNLWEMRWWLRELVLHRRRPLVPEPWGLGTWRQLLWLLPYVATLLNVIGITRNTTMLNIKTIHRFYNSKLDLGLQFFSTENLIVKWKKEEEEIDTQFRLYVKLNRYRMPFICYSPGQFFNGRNHYGFGVSGLNVSKVTVGIANVDRQCLLDLWYVKWHYALFVLITQLLVILLGMLLHNIVPKRSERVEEMVAAERTAKLYRTRRDAKRQHTTAQTDGDDGVNTY